MMSVPSEYVPYLVGAAIAVAIIFPAVVLLGDWKEARAKKKSEQEQPNLQFPHSDVEDGVWPPAPKA